MMEEEYLTAYDVESQQSDGTIQLTSNLGTSSKRHVIGIYPELDSKPTVKLAKDIVRLKTVGPLFSEADGNHKPAIIRDGGHIEPYKSDKDMIGVHNSEIIKLTPSGALIRNDSYQLEDHIGNMHIPYMGLSVSAAILIAGITIDLAILAFLVIPFTAWIMSQSLGINGGAKGLPLILQDLYPHDGDEEDEDDIREMVKFANRKALPKNKEPEKMFLDDYYMDDIRIDANGVIHAEDDELYPESSISPVAWANVGIVLSPKEWIHTCGDNCPDREHIEDWHGYRTEVFDVDDLSVFYSGLDSPLEEVADGIYGRYHVMQDVVLDSDGVKLEQQVIEHTWSIWDKSMAILESRTTS